jgi:hypothetical protein
MRTDWTVTISASVGVLTRPVATEHFSGSSRLMGSASRATGRKSRAAGAAPAVEVIRTPDYIEDLDNAPSLMVVS